MPWERAGEPQPRRGEYNLSPSRSGAGRARRAPLMVERSPEAGRVTATRSFCPGCEGDRDGDVPSVLPGLSVRRCGMLGLLRFASTSQPAASRSWAACSPWERGAGEGDTPIRWGKRSRGSYRVIWGAGGAEGIRINQLGARLGWKSGGGYHRQRRETS